MPKEEQLEQIRSGLELSHKGKTYRTRPCRVYQIETPKLQPRGKNIRSDRHGPSSWLKIIITEGKFRQIRKMTAKVGLPTLRLFRVRVGKYELGDLRVGETKEIEWNK